MHRHVTSAAASSGSASGSVEKKKLWGGRFTGATDPLMEQFNESLSVDRRMWREDIAGSQAYARALAKAGVITNEEADTLCTGLDEVAKEWETDSFVVCDGDEDIHTANERRLSEIVGPVGGKLHTGRSRNDQVATDTRLYLVNRLKATRAMLHELIEVACARAEKESDVLMPAFTHLQNAQPVRWSHWLLSHASAWQRDDQRLNDLIPRVATLPLGSGALAGNAFGVDRQAIAKELGFVGGVCPNSMDAVSDRDFVCETLFWASLLGVHLSRWSEDLIIYGSGPFAMVKFADAYATGSSLMPQKKNPDALELLRGKSARVMGNLTTMLTVLKGLPTTYNKDLQEDKEALFDALDTTDACLQIASGVLATTEIVPERMMAGLSEDMLATDIAEYLVRRGVPFRETHHIAGAAVALSEERGVSLGNLTVDDYKSLNENFGDDVLEVFDFGRSADSRDTEGGSSTRSVLEQVDKLRAYLKTAS